MSLPLAEESKTEGHYHIDHFRQEVLEGLKTLVFQAFLTSSFQKKSSFY